MTDLARLAEEYRAGWREGYRHGVNEGLLRAFPHGYDVGTSENPCLQFTNVVVQPGGEIIDEACLCRRKHNPASARGHACMLMAAADAAEKVQR